MDYYRIDDQNNLVKGCSHLRLKFLGKQKDVTENKTFFMYNCLDCKTTLMKKKQLYRFLNITNHPSEKWDDSQLYYARWFMRKELNNTGSEIIDCGFPNINPDWNMKEVYDFVHNWIEEHQTMPEILDFISGVLIQGEFCATTIMIQYFQEIECPCICACTERMVEEQDGKKIVKFEFKQFRNYPNLLDRSYPNLLERGY